MMGEIAGLFDRCLRLLMKVGDLVSMPGCLGFGTPTGIIIETNRGRPNRVQVYWFREAEASWEPKKWLEVASASR